MLVVQHRKQSLVCADTSIFKLYSIYGGMTLPFFTSISDKIFSGDFDFIANVVPLDKTGFFKSAKIPFQSGCR